MTALFCIKQLNIFYTSESTLSLESRIYDSQWFWHVHPDAKVKRDVTSYKIGSK